MVPATETAGDARVLYSFESRFRAPKMIAACFAFVIFALAAKIGSGSVVPASVPLWLGKSVFVFGALFALIIAARILLGVFRNEKTLVKITAAGISDSSWRSVSWDKIVQVVAGGSPADERVRLFYLVGSARWSVVHEILSTAPITPAMYQSLVETLRAEVLPQFPHVKLGDYEPARELS